MLVTENALDFRDDAAVEVRAVGTDEEIQLEVSDHGPGIPADQRDFAALGGGTRIAPGSKLPAPIRKAVETVRKATKR